MVDQSLPTLCPLKLADCRGVQPCPKRDKACPWFLVEEYQKEELLEWRRIERELDACDLSDAEACERLVSESVRTAHEKLARFRFGNFSGKSASIVFCNMGPSALDSAEWLRRNLSDQGVSELASAVWPTSAPPYSWAMMIADPDGDKWADVARKP